MKFKLIKADKKQEEYNRAYNAINLAIYENLIDENDDFDDVYYELMQEADIEDPDALSDKEFEHWRKIFLEAWQFADWRK